MSVRYIVIRAAPDLPAALRDRMIARGIEGRWEAVEDDWRAIPATYDRPDDAMPGLVAVRTDRFETNEAGQAARVYEVRP